MVHPNIVAVYSITLRPSTAPAPPGLNIQPGSGSSGDVLLLDQGPSSGAGGAAAAGTGAAACASVTPHVVAGTAELLPWEMQLVMEYCDQVRFDICYNKCYNKWVLSLWQHCWYCCWRVSHSAGGGGCC
jgi:hypothetical protein